jgi:hypothetical protein
VLWLTRTPLERPNSFKATWQSHWYLQWSEHESKGLMPWQKHFRDRYGTFSNCLHSWS